MNTTQDFDYAVVGGGLQGCLLAHALAHHRPRARVLLVERNPILCGNHTWSFHESDVLPSAHGWLDPLVTHRWPAYSVRFPSLFRRVEIPYATITSDALRDATLQLADPSKAAHDRTLLSIRCGEDCSIDSPSRLSLASGETIDSGVVIDCRGRAGQETPLPGCGFQTFIGHEVETGSAWPATEPILMDVRPDQARGFEFLYELPLAPCRVLIEYTRFSDEATCDESRAEERIFTRIREAGVESAKVIRVERGCLPMPYATPSVGGQPTVSGGYAGGWFHAATGYSMPLAIRFAETVASSAPHLLMDELTALASRDESRRRFARFLNRLLFRLVSPEHRWKVFRRFYRVLPEERISRFYAHRFTLADAAKIIIGRPPTGLDPLRFARSFLSNAGPPLR